MPRPTTMNEWWKMVLDTRANGKVALLAQLLGVNVRTLHRWQTQDITIPDLQRRKVIQQVVGPELLRHPACPKYLKFKIVKKVVSAPAPAVPAARKYQPVAPPRDASWPAAQKELGLADFLKNA